MKCLDKKRIKMKQGETLALNERIMLSLVSTGVSLAILSRENSKRMHETCVCILVGVGDGIAVSVQRGILEGMQRACNQSDDVLVDTEGILSVCWLLKGRLMWAGGSIEHVAGSVISAVS